MDSAIIQDTAYIGQRTSPGLRVERIAICKSRVRDKVSLPLKLHVRSFAATFDWGNNTNEAAQLSLAIMYDHASIAQARRFSAGTRHSAKHAAEYYASHFLDEIVRRLPTAGFIITSAGVQRWLNYQNWNGFDLVGFRMCSDCGNVHGDICAFSILPVEGLKVYNWHRGTSRDLIWPQPQRQRASEYR